jgi:o-succinylbenzoate---CoA ligase
MRAESVPLPDAGRLRAIGGISVAPATDTLAPMKEWLSEAASLRPDHPFLVTPMASVTFSEAEDRVSRMAGAMLEVGMEPGTVAALWASNDVASALALFSLWRIGATALLLNTRLTEEEAAALVRESGADAAFGDDVPDLGVPRHGVDGLEGRVVDADVVDPDVTAWIVHTSGSAGRPKGVRLTFGNLEASAMGSALHLDHRGTDRWLCNLPLFHVGGASILVRSARQATTALLEPGFDPVRTAALLGSGDVTLASLVSVTLARTLDVHPGRYSGVRAVMVGGGPVPDDLVARAHAAGLPVLPTYGMTETGSQIATVPLRDAHEPAARLVPIPGAEITVAEGRIRVKGPMVTAGYHGEPDRDPDAWFETGDLGVLEADGSLTVLGRADDVIVTGGENVFPGEIEAVIREHPGIDDAAVIGLSDSTWGEVVVAVYEGSAAPGELERHVRYRLAGFKVPRRWARVERLPRLSIGKIDRSALRQSLALET